MKFQNQERLHLLVPKSHMKKLIKQAKEALNLDITNIRIPFNNFKPSIHRDILSK